MRRVDPRWLVSRISVYFCQCACASILIKEHERIRRTLENRLLRAGLRKLRLRRKTSDVGVLNHTTETKTPLNNRYNAKETRENSQLAKDAGCCLHTRFQSGFQWLLPKKLSVSMPKESIGECHCFFFFCQYNTQLLSACHGACLIQTLYGNSNQRPNP